MIMITNLGILSLLVLCVRAAPPSLRLDTNTIPKLKDTDTNNHNGDVAIPFSPGFAISGVISQAQTLPSHSWEFGTASEALLELYNSSLSIYGTHPFPSKLDVTSVPSLVYAKQNIVIGTGNDILSNGTGAAGDPASLGVSATLLGLDPDNKEYADAAKREVDYLVGTVPRFSNGAISHRADYPELWADFMYMAPPFLAYYGAFTQNLTLLNLTVEQCTLYRQVLKANLSNSVPWNGVWMHIIGPENQDTGLWSTGNAWAAAGMMRVLATVLKAPLPSYSSHEIQVWRKESVTKLRGYIMEILDGVLGAPLDNGLLRNYLDDVNNEDGLGYGETSGSALLASVAYRISTLFPDDTPKKYVKWADGIQKTLRGHVEDDGVVTPAVNPLNWRDTTPYTAGSPEGENFVVLMYAAWRDCVRARVCNYK